MLIIQIIIYPDHEVMRSFQFIKYVNLNVYESIYRAKSEIQICWLFGYLYVKVPINQISSVVQCINLFDKFYPFWNNCKFDSFQILNIKLHSNHLTGQHTQLVEIKSEPNKQPNG